jgi:hypothetical protein
LSSWQSNDNKVQKKKPTTTTLNTHKSHTKHTQIHPSTWEISSVREDQNPAGDEEEENLTRGKFYEIIKKGSMKTQLHNLIPAGFFFFFFHN